MSARVANGVFTCECGAMHERGAVDGQSGYRCLACGKTFRIDHNVEYCVETGFVPPDALGVRHAREITEALTQAIIQVTAALALLNDNAIGSRASSVSHAFVLTECEPLDSVRVIIEGVRERVEAASR